MQRVTVSLDEALARDFDELSVAKGYSSRSEAVRDLVREAVAGARIAADENGWCVAALSYAYDHHVRALAARLTALQHRHHEFVISTMHVHLDHDTCLESMILKGPAVDVRMLADTIRAERGVRFTKLNLIAVEPNAIGEAGANHGRADHAHLSLHPG